MLSLEAISSKGGGSFGVLDEVSDSGVVFANRLKNGHWFREQPCELL